MGTDGENSCLTGSPSQVLVIRIRTKGVDHPLGVEAFHILWLWHLDCQLFPAAATVRLQLATHSVEVILMLCVPSANMASGLESQ